MSPQDDDPLCTSLGLLDEPPSSAPARPLALLLDHLEGRSPFAGFVDRIAGLFAIPRGDAKRLLADAAAASGWEPMFPGATVRRCVPGAALRGPDHDAGLVRIGPSLVFPFHEHGGEERTLVLQGGFVDELTGRHLLPGDTLVLSAGTAHRFRIDPGEACICAVLLLGPLSFAP